MAPAAVSGDASRSDAAVRRPTKDTPCSGMRGTIAGQQSTPVRTCPQVAGVARAVCPLHFMSTEQRVHVPPALPPMR
jgi:hypothetical protein